MFLLRHGRAGVVQAADVTAATRISRRYASKIAIPFSSKAPPFPVTEACPAPTCPCRASPPGLDIEREKDLNGTMAAYGAQVLICTGRDDWKSKIEDDDEAVLVRRLRGLLLRDGKYSDPYHNVLITNSSFPPSKSPSVRNPRAAVPTSTPRSDPVARPGKDPDVAPQHGSDGPPASAFILPSFQYVPAIPNENSAVEAFIEAYILPQQINPGSKHLSRVQKDIKFPNSSRQEFVGARKVEEILVLICGHGARDERCGKLGPILRDEFKEKLQRQSIAVLEDPPVAEAPGVNTNVEGYVPAARVGLISHIGGHKWAGNVIVYIPPSFTRNPLAGKGIWYGRVDPKHVEGIVAQTVMGGKVIKDLFRGGIDGHGETLFL